jgi:hypothetical protein
LKNSLQDSIRVCFPDGWRQGFVQAQVPVVDPRFVDRIPAGVAEKTYRGEAKHDVLKYKNALVRRLSARLLSAPPRKRFG